MKLDGKRENIKEKYFNGNHGSIDNDKKVNGINNNYEKSR